MSSSRQTAGVKTRPSAEPVESSSSSSGTSSINIAEEMMRKMSEMMTERDKKYDQERAERERVVSEEKAMLLKLLNERNNERA